MLNSFVDELSKIAAGGNISASSSYKGTNLASGSSLPRSSGMPRSVGMTAKPTNYSIVHNEAPKADYGDDPTISKVNPPTPPVRT
jgi:hypothetical protein